MMRRWLFLWALPALVWLVLSAPAVAARTLLIYGDSLSAGYGLPRDKTWVALLAAHLKHERPDYTVANASISGETTLGGLNRIGDVLAKHKPAIVLLALGANDGLRGQKLEAIRSNLEGIIAACRKSNAQVLLIGMRVPPNYGNDYAHKFHAIYADLARQHKVALVPFLLEGFADKPDWFQSDGVHPALRAQPQMYETVWKALAPLLITPKVSAGAKK